MAKGEGRARIAAEQAVTSPLLDNISVEGAMGVLINIVGGPDMKMKEIQEAASYIQEQAHEEANIIFGASIDETMGDALKVTVIATGFEEVAEESVPEVSREIRRAPERPARDTMVSSLGRPVSSLRQPTQRSGAEVAAAIRRTAAQSASLQASAAPSFMPEVRSRIAFPASTETEDWDTPAFVRRSAP